MANICALLLLGPMLQGSAALLKQLNGVAVAVIVRILGAQQVLLVEAVVDLQVPLILVALH